MAFLAVLLFFAAAGGGFALSRYVGGEQLLPPKDQVQTTTSTPSKDHPDTVSPRSGNAGGTDKPGGGFTVPVPRDWIEFVELINDLEFPGSTRVYYVSPDGTQQLTVERFPAYYPKYAIADYLDRLQSAEPGVTIDIVYQRDIPGIEPASSEPSLELNYRATANTKVLAPDDQVAQDQTRATFARLLPYAGDLWVVSVTVPIDQEDSGNELFERTVPEFRVTG